MQFCNEQLEILQAVEQELSAVQSTACAGLFIDNGSWVIVHQEIELTACLQMDFSSHSDFSDGTGGARRPWSAPGQYNEDKLSLSSLTALLTGPSAGLQPLSEDHLGAPLTMDAIHLQGEQLKMQCCMFKHQGYL